ncbi:MAG: hypothetical protein M5R41_17440 [Bacteroidia bacterium]|nr:hypothetical protein [Bacteroidia bacterium]
MLHRLFAIALCLGCTALFSGCLEVTTSTIAYEDGSLVRAISMTGDSTKVRTGPFPFHFDESWKISRKALGDGRERVRAEKRFANADAMNKKLRGRGNRLEVHARYENRFDWFYTIHSYEETWKRFDPFNAVPLSDFLTPEEIDALQRTDTDDDAKHGRSDSLMLENAENHFELWRQRNLFESFYLILEKGIRRVTYPELTIERLRAMKETLFVQCIDALEESQSATLPDNVGGLLATPAARAALAANEDELRKFDEKKFYLKSIMEHSYTTRLRMPGMLQSTNSRIVKGSMCEWKDFIGSIMIGDYSMRAESRSLNWSFVILCALLALAALGVLLRYALRRRA